MSVVRSIRARLIVLPLVALTGVGLLAGIAAPARASGTGGGGAGAVVTIPISFQVRNVNRSKVACSADGKTYTVRGDLVAPASAAAADARTGAVTLYLHGLSFGEFFWDFDAVGGYDYAAKQARAGETSVIIDRLGYGASDKPLGTDICVGSRADIAHQMVLDLKTGNYHFGSRNSGVRFEQVYLAGHSYGGQIAQVEAYSFGDIAGLIVISYTDTGQTALLRKNGKYAARVCAAGGHPVAPGGPGGYAPFGPPAGAAAALFHDVDPTVLAAAKPLLSLDPCGDTASFAAATAADLTRVHSIDVPVLLIQGGADALFDVTAQPHQAALYSGAPTVTTESVPDTAHAVTLERTRNLFASDVATWLRDQEAR